MEQLYVSKVDTWLAAALIVAGLVVVGTLIAFPYARNPVPLLARLPILIIGVGLPLWIFMSTHYTLSNTSLRVQCGPFSWRVPLADITSITPTRNPLGSPALSLDRLRIDYGDGKTLMISPKLKEQFLQDLDARRAAAP
ncbi:MAG: PH domain-containing protein [Pseudomonadales bacterium]|jgi:hypothetical protein|nr:PH domain-containing protein [Pseudomonadales bacterium]